MRAYKATYGNIILSAGIDRIQVIKDALRRLKEKKLLLLNNK